MQRIFITSLVASFFVIGTTAALNMFYVLVPSVVPPMVTPSLLLAATTVALLFAGIMTCWAGWNTGSKWYYLFGLGLLVMGGATYTFDIPTLPRHGMWPAEQVELWLNWCTLWLSAFLLWNLHSQK